MRRPIMPATTDAAKGVRGGDRGGAQTRPLSICDDRVAIGGGNSADWERTVNDGKVTMTRKGTAAPQKTTTKITKQRSKK